MTVKAIVLVALTGLIVSLSLAASPPPQGDTAAVIEASNAFAADLYGKLAAEKKGNLFFSPGSIHTALAMTYAGAAGNTADQMAKTLHFTLPADKLSAAYGSLLTTLNNPPGANGQPPAYQLTVANALWGQKGYTFKPAFTQLLQKSYGAGLNDVDFAQAEAARKTINDWVAQKTKDKITDLIPSGVLDDKTRLVLTNAIYFKSNWLTPFSKNSTKDGAFRLSADKSVDVPLMLVDAYCGYMETDDLQVLDLPYARRELSMIVILPKKVDGLAEVEKNLSASSLAKWLAEKKPADVDVTLPRFKFSDQFMLSQTLQRLGMTDAFSDRANFSGMTDKEQLFISHVLHKAFVAVDEEGTEAAAATAVLMKLTAMPMRGTPKVFKADHPFLFLIRHNATGEVLFMGRLANPKGE